MVALDVAFRRTTCAFVCVATTDKSTAVMFCLPTSVHSTGARARTYRGMMGPRVPVLWPLESLL